MPVNGNLFPTVRFLKGRKLKAKKLKGGRRKEAIREPSFVKAE